MPSWQPPSHLSIPTITSTHIHCTTSKQTTQSTVLATTLSCIHPSNQKHTYSLHSIKQANDPCPPRNNPLIYIYPTHPSNQKHTSSNQSNDPRPLDIQRGAKSFEINIQHTRRRTPLICKHQQTNPKHQATSHRNTPTRVIPKT